jgi:hypothetical protein
MINTVTKSSSEVTALTEKANSYESNGINANLNAIVDYTNKCVSEANPEVLSRFLKQCIIELNPYPAIRVLRASFRARTNCGPWRPFCVKVFHDYAKQVGEERARADMAGLIEDFAK